jgi:hypothetical protein
MAFMDDYEGNKDRTNRWISTFPEGRLECQIVEFNAEKGYVLVQAKGWRNQTEIYPAGVDYAYGYLAAYSEKMKRWMIEDTCTSALMRVMALILGGSDKATKEVISNLEKLNQIGDAFGISDDDLWNTNQVLESPGPSCKHGARIMIEGISKKTNEPYRGYKCSAKDEAEQCEIQWHVKSLTSGTWRAK